MKLQIFLALGVFIVYFNSNYRKNNNYRLEMNCSVINCNYILHTLRRSTSLSQFKQSSNAYFSNYSNVVARFISILRIVFFFNYCQNVFQEKRCIKFCFLISSLWYAFIIFIYLFLFFFCFSNQKSGCDFNFVHLILNRVQNQIEDFCWTQHFVKYSHFQTNNF